MKVLIVGGGIGGLTLAAFLKEKNIDFDIIEKAPNWENMGFAIHVWNNGRRILKKLNLHHKLDHAGYTETDYYLATGKGKLLKLFHMREFQKKFWPAYIAIHRADLHNILMDKIKGHQVRMGINVKKVLDNDLGAEVEFSDGTSDIYDLVVGADGLKSQVRDMVFGTNFLKYLGWRAYFTWIDQRFRIPRGLFEMSEAGQFVLFSHQKEGKNMAVLAMPAKPLEWDDAETRLERIQHQFTDCKFLLPQILAVSQGEDLLPTDIAFVKMDNWVKGRVVLIGDAAHAMEPFAGMGGSMAMEDAYVLAEELEKNTNDLGRALQDYQRRRFPRIERARRQTRGMWWWAKPTSGIIMFLRNMLTGIFPVKHFTEGYKRILAEKI